MPIYNYECKKCGERFELRRSLNDSDEEIGCPRCGVAHPRRVFSLFAIPFSRGSTGCSPSAST